MDFLKEYLIYSSAEVPDSAVFKISPSAFSKFIEKPHEWYRSEVLKEKGFTHNTSTVIGTIVHACAAAISKGEMVDRDAIDEYIDSLEIKDDYNPDEVHQFYPDMAECLVNDYVLNRDFLEVEKTFCAEIADKHYAAGTLDRLEGTKDDCMVVDYKTYNSKIKPKVIPAYYKYQLLTYALILKKNGYNPTRIRLVYVNRYIDGGVSDKTGKPLKSYFPEVTELTETITEEDLDFIESLLKLCVDSVQAALKYPELTHVIFHDPRLRSL